MDGVQKKTTTAPQGVTPGTRQRSSAVGARGRLGTREVRQAARRARLAATSRGAEVHLPSVDRNPEVHSQVLGKEGRALADRLIQTDENKIGILKERLDAGIDSKQIPEELKPDFSAAIDYVGKLDTDIARMKTLLNIASQGPLDSTQLNELNALVQSNQYNINAVALWLNVHEQELEKSVDPTFAFFTLSQGLKGYLAEKNVHIANALAECGASQGGEDVVSREDRINFSLLHAKSALGAVQSLNTRELGLPPGFKESLMKDVQDLHDRVEQSKLTDKSHQPPEVSARLKLLDKGVWEQSFPLVASGKGDESAIKDFQEKWKGAPVGQSSENLLPASHPKISQNRLLREYIQFRLQEAGVKKTDMPNIKFLMAEGHNKAVNQQDWEPIDKRVEYTVQSRNGAAEVPPGYAARSTITPAKAIQQHFALPYSGLNNGMGCADRLTQYQHVPNLAATRLHDEDGKVLFSGLRHGVLDAYQINKENLRNLSEAQLTRMVQDLLPGTDLLPQDFSAEQIDDLVTRIGTHDATAEKCAEQMRKVASNNMARELVTAALIDDPAKFNAALAGRTVPITMNSISLLTPDLIRQVVKDSSSQEKTMLKYQTEALQRLNDQSRTGPIKLKVRDDKGNLKEVNVHVRVRTFNFGVNEGAVGSLGRVPMNLPIVRDVAGGWGSVKTQNDLELERLVGDKAGSKITGEVGSQLREMEEEKNRLTQQADQIVREWNVGRDNPDVKELDNRAAALDRKITNIQTAADQVVDLWRSGDYRKGQNEPYKMVSRLAFLSHQIGETTAFNCKSGKDRTGQLDADAKFVSAIASKDKVPELNSTALRESRSNFTLNTGNLEMQRLNTGLAGFKLRGLPGLDLLVSEGKKPVYQGGSSYVKK